MPAICHRDAWCAGTLLSSHGLQQDVCRSQAVNTFHALLQDLNDRLLAVQSAQGHWHTPAATTRQGFCSGGQQTPDELRQAGTPSRCSCINTGPTCMFTTVACRSTQVEPPSRNNRPPLHDTDRGAGTSGSSRQWQPDSIAGAIHTAPARMVTSGPMRGSAAGLSAAVDWPSTREMIRVLRKSDRYSRGWSVHFQGAQQVLLGQLR